jgi:transcriptional regulator with XRE-family HTH domain
MSSTFYKTFAAPNVKRSKQIVVSAQLQALSEFVRAVMNEKGLNYRQVAERSGGLISHTTVFDVVNLRSKDVKATTLRGLAKGLGVSDDEIFSVARGKSPTDDPEYKNWKYATLFDNAKQLTPEQMVKFENIMEIAQREVDRMLQEKANEPPRKKGKKS